MKKFKNIRLMLLGLLAIGSMNAFALDGSKKTDGTARYQVISEAAATVKFMGISKTIAAPTEVTIPATVSLVDDDATSQKTYTVTEVADTWWTGVDVEGTRTVSDLTKLTFLLRTDWDADITFGGSNKVYDAIDQFKATLKEVTIKNAHKVHGLPVLNACAVLEKIDFSEITNDGAELTVTTNFVNGLKNLKSVKLPSEPLKIDIAAFKGIQGTDDKGNATEVKDIDISNATKIFDEAFQDAFITKAVIGENVSKFYTSAFTATSIANAHLTSVEWYTNKIMDGDPAQPKILAGFAGQVNIASVKVVADKVKEIVAGVFTSCAPVDDKGDAIPFVLDLSGAPALAKIDGAIANIPYGTLKLQGTALAGESLDGILGFTLATKSQSSLKTLTLPDGLTKMTAGEFNGYEKLETITVNMAEIPDNAFKDATVLKGLVLGNKVTTIGKNAFDGTNLNSITIPGGVTTIKDGAFANIKPNGADGKPVAVPLDLDGAVKLNSLGTGVFKDTNIGATVDFTNTAVTVIPASAFEKTTANKFLTGVTLKEGSASSKTSIGASAFKNNEGLASVNKLNQANYDFSAKPADDKPGIGTSAFENTALDKVELDATPITVIASFAFAENEELKSVKLNAETTTIGISAFEGDHQLATVEGLNQAKLTSIGNYAFAESALTTLDLSGATALSSIGIEAFSAGKSYNDKTKAWDIYNPTLATVTFPAETKAESATKFDEYTNKITSIGAGAFLHQKKVTALNNLKDTKILTLEQLFSNNKAADIDKQAGTSGFDDQTPYCPAGLTEIVLPSTKLEFYAGLTTINHYALQGLGITEVTIPSTVTGFGGCVLQGNVDLTTVIWNPAAPTSILIGGTSATAIHKYTFRGCSNLEKFEYMTTTALKSKDLQDIFFYWCSKDKLRVYVTAESLKVLEADGYTTANAQYSKLNDTLEDFITFSPSGLNSADNMYYRTYFNDQYATWIEASDDLVVYTAKFDGAKVVMDKAKVEEGYYKIKKYNSTDAAYATAIIASATDKVKVEYYALDGNNKSTLDGKNNELKVNYGTTPKAASKLSYFFKLGKGPQGIGFYRITTGEFKPNAVYLQAADAARMADFYPLAGEETAIKAIEQMVEDDAPVYNLQGVRVNAAQKGMFIKNGKKFIVK